MDESETDKLLTVHEVSEQLGLPVGTLNQWRSQGKGPRYVKFENRHVRYRQSVINQYIDDHTHETD